MSANNEKEAPPTQEPQDAKNDQQPSSGTVTPQEGGDVPEKKKREYKDFGHDEEKATRESLIFLAAFSAHTTRAHACLASRRALQMQRSTCPR